MRTCKCQLILNAALVCQHGDIKITSCLAESVLITGEKHEQTEKKQVKPLFLLWYIFKKSAFLK